MVYLIITSVTYNKFRIVQLTVTNIWRFYYMNPILQNLCCLPVRPCIYFKILLTTYKSINNVAPGYLHELISIRKLSPKLSSSVYQLKPYLYIAFAFSVTVPTLWNRLGVINKCLLFKSLLGIFYTCYLGCPCTVPFNGLC